MRCEMRLRNTWPEFWAASTLNVDDEVNDGIWSQSIAVQKEIQPPDDLLIRDDTPIGAQQAMVDPDPDCISPIGDGTILPWVPDLVGSKWDDSDSLIIVGTAYAGFIREYN